MAKRLDSRLRQLERRRRRPEPIQVWISHADGDTVHCAQTGETLTLAEFRRRYPSAMHVNLTFGADDDGERATR